MDGEDSENLKIGLTFRIGPSLFKYIEILYEKIKKYKWQEDKTLKYIEMGKKDEKTKL